MMLETVQLLRSQAVSSMRAPERGRTSYMVKQGVHLGDINNGVAIASSMTDLWEADGVRKWSAQCWNKNDLLGR